MNRNVMFALGLLTFAASSAQTQTPKEILAKSEAVYKSAKTYQAEYTQKMKNELVDMVITGNMKFQGNKYRLEITTKNKTMTTEQTMVSDGKNVIVFMPALNGYSKTPLKNGWINELLTPLVRIGGAIKNPLKKLPDTTLDGAAVYVIEAAFGGSGGGKGTSTLSIDKKTYCLKCAVNVVEKTKFVETYLKETFNAPIPPQTFVFTPPAGSTPLK